MVNEPRSFPRALLVELKRLFRTLWGARGGGYYACGFAVTFIWLEVTTLLSEVAGATSIGSFLSEQLVEFIIRFSLQSIENTVQAFLWPVAIIQRWELVGIAGLYLGYLLFRYVIKTPLTRWLFDDELSAADERLLAGNERPESDERRPEADA